MSKKAWSPGRSRRSEKTCGCGMQRSPETALIASTCSEPSSKRRRWASATTSELLHPGAKDFVDPLVGRVDDRRGVVEQRDLLVGLDRARGEHHLRAVGGLEAGALQGGEGDHVGHVDADRLVLEAALLQLAEDVGGEFVGDAGVIGHRAAHRRDAAAEVLRRQPRRVHLVMFRGRAEVPEDGQAVARQQREARVLVAGPLADVGRGDVADVVRVEQQQRAEIRFLQLGLGAGKPVAAEFVEIDPLLPVHAHRGAS